MLVEGPQRGYAPFSASPQEAVANAFRHGGASVIEILGCGRKDGALPSWEIGDNGRGCPGARAAKGAGSACASCTIVRNTLGGTLVVIRAHAGGISCPVRRPPPWDEEQSMIT